MVDESEVKPIRPEGPNVRAPGWSDSADRVSQETSAIARDQWLNAAQARDHATHENLANGVEQSQTTALEQSNAITERQRSSSEMSHAEIHSKLSVSEIPENAREQPSREAVQQHIDDQSNRGGAEQEKAARTSLEQHVNAPTRDVNMEAQLEAARNWEMGRER